MKLYTIPISPNCRRVEATIRHLSINVEIHTANMMDGELKEDDFLSLNPNGRVPLLVDGDLKLWESNAIIQYLADKCDADEFYPRDVVSRADVNRWQFWECLHFNKALGGICWETLVKPMMKMGDPDESIIDSSTAAFQPFAKILNAELEGRKFMYGDTVSLADFSVGSHSALAQHPDSRVPLDDYPNVKRWYESLEEVPAWAETAPSF